MAYIEQPRSVHRTTPTWQQDLQQAFRDGHALLRFLKLAPGDLPVSLLADPSFPCLVPRPFAARMKKGDPQDPLLLQVLPQRQELITPPGYDRDPLQEDKANVGAGVLHKYPGRALLVTTGACPVHCRYCFRRHFPYHSTKAGQNEWHDAVERLAALANLHEVILSGGDPLSLSNRRLTSLLAALSRLPHLKILRVHTRFPVMLPSRIDAGLLSLLTRSTARIVIVLHANHPNEIDASVADSLASLRSAGITLLNQSVLLRGINDCPEVLARLSETLFEADVLPYYLHLLDPVAGAAHFDVSAARGRALVSRLRERLPGYLVPRLVRETPGAFSKTLMA